jgi:nucleoside-diphosphate-sugar epimerase
MKVEAYAPFYNSKTVVVTGGLGMIGSFVCDELLGRGARVIVVDDESKGGWTYCGHLRGQVEHRKGTLEEAAFAKEALAEADVVVHLASRTCGVGFSSKLHLDLLEQNNRVTANLLAAIRSSPPSHLLVASSSCVYSDEAQTPMDDRQSWSGEPELVNRGYGWAKRFLEQMSEVVCSELRVPLTIVRPVNVYGERYHWMGAGSQAIPMLVKRIMEGENPLVVWGSGNQRRSYVHAADCARIMVELVELAWTRGPVNIGSEETASVREVALALAQAAGRDIALTYDITKPEGRFIKAANSTRLREALGGKAPLTINLTDGMRRMVDWYSFTFCRA